MYIYIYIYTYINLYSLLLIALRFMCLSHTTRSLLVYPFPVSYVREYRKKVRALVDGVISRLPLTLPVTWDSPFWIIMMVRVQCHTPLHPL